MKKKRERTFLNVSIPENEKVQYHKCGNYREVFITGPVKKGRVLLPNRVIKRPRLEHAKDFTDEHLQKELEHWSKLAKIIPVPKYLGSVKHKIRNRVDVFEYAGRDLEDKYDFSKGFNRQHFINEHTQALNATIRAWVYGGIGIDPKPANFTDGLVHHKLKDYVPVVHYIDEGVDEMAGTLSNPATADEFGSNLGLYFFDVYSKEKVLRNQDQLTKKLISATKLMLKKHVSNVSKRTKVIKTMMTVFNFSKENLLKGVSLNE